MEGAARREELLRILHDADHPVSAGTLAARFAVSRQVIVGDVALLRAAGEEISATPKGYVVRSPDGILMRVACLHSGADMGRELNAIVDQGCTVLDVMVEHPVYGQLSGILQVSSRSDVARFLERCAASDARPLSMLTEGIHLHTLACPDAEAFQRARRSLRELGFLLEDRETES